MFIKLWINLGIDALEPGVYTIDGQVRIGSNTKLTGSPDAIIRVSTYKVGVSFLGRSDLSDWTGGRGMPSSLT